MTEYNTKEAVAKLAEDDRELAELVKSGQHGDLRQKLTIAQLVARSRQNPTAIPPDTEKEFEIHATMRDSHQASIRVYKQSPVSGNCPAVVLIHGGAFAFGHNTDVSLFARTFANLYNTTVLSLSYRLAPEFKFPTAPNDIWDSLQWLFSPANVPSWSANSQAGFIIGGISSGGNLAAVTAQKWLDGGMSPALKGIWLSIPYLLEQNLVPGKYADLWFSREQNANAMVINKASVEWSHDAYSADTNSPDLSPFNAKEPHRGLPRVYFQVCGQDPLRDDGLVYERVLRDNGVETKLDVYPGVPHGHFTIFPTLKASKKSISDSVKGLSWLLRIEQPSDDEITSALAAAV